MITGVIIISAFAIGQQFSCKSGSIIYRLSIYRFFNRAHSVSEGCCIAKVIKGFMRSGKLPARSSLEEGMQTYCKIGSSAGVQNLHVTYFEKPEPLLVKFFLVCSS